MSGFTNIQDWMLDLHLDIWETMMYAVIYSFSQDGESTFRGSQNYLATKCKCSRAKVARGLLHLVDLGMIRKIDRTTNGVKFCEYSAFTEEGGCICEIQGVSTGYRVYPTDTGCISETHNNKEYINKDINIITPKSPSYTLPFSSERFVDLWRILCDQPKWRKKSDSALQMSLAKLSGVSEEEACKMMEDSIANGWQGLFPRKESRSNGQTSVYDHNASIMANILGNGNN